MGWTSYSTVSRSVRAAELSYATAPVASTFTQTTKRCVHEEMDSRKVNFRECRDSEAHKLTVPIVLALDVTASMGDIPRQLIADGLPTLMSRVIQEGCADAALLFLAIGDHECDSYPVQVAQFESGDAELDMWLTRTYLERGGGGNAGESYPLAWEFAANRIESDAWDKRKEKGFLFTIGDEPFLKKFPSSAFKQIYGENARVQSTLTADEMYEAACKKFHVFHISVEERRGLDSDWTRLLGENVIRTKDHTDIPRLISEKIIQFTDAPRNEVAPKKSGNKQTESKKENDTPWKGEEVEVEML